MASKVVSNGSLYMNMTLSELISRFREAEAEKTKLIGSCSCKDYHLRRPQKPLEVEKKKVGLWVRKSGSFRDGNVKRERKTKIEESVRKVGTLRWRNEENVKREWKTELKGEVEKEMKEIGSMKEMIVLSVLVVLWGLRLGLFLLFSGDWREDRHFDEMRNNLGKLAVFWTFQAVWVWTVSLPVTVVNASDRNPFLQPEDMGCVFYNRRFRAITSSYYRGALGALLVYDITRRATYESVRKWLRELREYGNQDMVVILVGNKCDLKESRQVEEEEGRVVAEEEGLCFMETSALQNLKVEEAFLEMITKIHDVTIHKSLEAKRNDTLSMMMNLSNGKEISLDDEVTATKHQSNYCCSR
ncbi:ras-related protein RABA6b-like [Senna tora]|uniref:Ras-related protein RABA6b-like n=1 Tax=Senna tora TaxID=362788 RepID=A0A834WIN4_9FABA|nr:ras-related protein RABA6b-like [Senna tora]